MREVRAGNPLSSSLPPPPPSRLDSPSVINNIVFVICLFIEFDPPFVSSIPKIYILTAKEKENALLKETLIERDKEIVDLKEKLSQLQQNGPRNQLDFAKQMAIMDEKLQETRKNIEELENGLNFSLLKKETKFKSKPQTFNGE